MNVPVVQTIVVKLWRKCSSIELPLLFNLLCVDEFPQSSLKLNQFQELNSSCHIRAGILLVFTHSNLASWYPRCSAYFLYGFLSALRQELVSTTRNNYSHGHAKYDSHTDSLIINCVSDKLLCWKDSKAVFQYRSCTAFWTFLVYLQKNPFKLFVTSQ